MKIIVEEEYGYRYWLWELKASSKTGVERHFNKTTGASGNDYWYCTGKPEDHFTIGEWKQLEFPEYKVIIDNDDYDAAAHIHQNDDSWISFRDDPIHCIDAGEEI